MENNTLYASNITYEFEKSRINGVDSEYVLKNVKNSMEKNDFPDNLEYLDDFYDKDTGSSGTAFKDKDTGEVILAYTGTNLDNDKWNDAVKTDFGRIARLPSNINYIKEKYPQTYNFIKSVENNQNDIQNYYGEK